MCVLYKYIVHILIGTMIYIYLYCYIYREMILAKNESYKLEILNDIILKSQQIEVTQDTQISIYHMNRDGVSEWWDLCAGPHVENTGQIDIKALELQSVAGAYWKGDENNTMLTVSHKVHIWCTYIYLYW